MRRLPQLPVAGIAFVLTVAFAVIAGFLVLHGSDDQRHHVEVLGKRVQLTASESLGHAVFADHCAQCHQLAASHSVGNAGPDLDSVHPSYSAVLSSIENGGVSSYGDMPANLATGPDLYAVARYVSRVANPAAFHP